MERKRIEKFVVLLLIGILIPVSLFPFHVNAETIDSHIRGRNYTYEPITYNKIQLTQNTYYENIGVFHITFELDDEYIGYVLPNYSIQYDNYFYGASNPNWGTLTKTFDRRIFVNGSSFSFDVSISWYSISINTAPSGDPFNYDSYTITSSDVTKYADIDSLDQIINILQDNQDIINDIYEELQIVVTNTSLANDYLEKLVLLRELNIPIESYNYIIPLLTYDNREIIDFRDIFYLNYPVFSLNIGDTITPLFSKGVYNPAKIIFYFFTDSNGTFDRNSLETTNITSYDLNIKSSTNLNGGYLYLVELSNVIITSGYARFRYKGSYNTKFIPIYLGNMNNINVSTDFAIIFGLNNQLLEDLHIIAQGTTQSSSASGSLDQTTSQFSSDANDLVTIEESFNDSMNDSLENVSPVFNMGSSFLTSANWVSQQFNRIVNNTPFASLITFGLTLGLGLLIIGKVRK